MNDKPTWSDAASGMPTRIRTPRDFTLEIATMLIEKEIGFEFVPDPDFDVFNFDGGKPATVGRASKEFCAWKQVQPWMNPGGPPELHQSGMPLPPKIQ